MATRYSWHTKDSHVISNWVAQRIPGCERGFGNCVGMGIWDECLIGGIVFHNWNPEWGVMEMSGAADKKTWLTRPVIRAAHNYIFETCQLAVLKAHESNPAVWGPAQSFGYQAYRVPRLRGRDEAEIILTLTEEDWRKSRFNK